ncbi:unnamed protein product [Rhizopus stolonifer]
MSSTGSIPDFVKKLFNMLEENTYPHVFSWGKEGDTFVVKDTNEFARHILPRHFKHSNFASFVRQLNKYNFHKLNYLKTVNVFMAIRLGNLHILISSIIEEIC